MYNKQTRTEKQLYLKTKPPIIVTNLKHCLKMAKNCV